tara:strand:- start:37 stop:480 length:444 start_codon:yes stop_codon:yes gene_type:complete
MDIKSRLKRLVTPISDYRHQKGRLTMDYTRKELEILSHTKFATSGRWEAHYESIKSTELQGLKLYEEDGKGKEWTTYYEIILAEWDCEETNIAPMKWIEVYDNKAEALLAYKGYQQLNLTPYLCGSYDFDMDNPEYYIIRDGETDEN